jgi:hypothetical protein
MGVQLSSAAQSAENAPPSETSQGQDQQGGSTSNAQAQVGDNAEQQQQAPAPERGGLNLLRMLRGSSRK